MRIKIPNVLTIGRIIIVPIFVLSFYKGCLYLGKIQVSAQMLQILQMIQFQFYLAANLQTGTQTMHIKPSIVCVTINAKYKTHYCT